MVKFKITFILISKGIVNIICNNFAN